jgi:hypothetical protein
MHASQLLPPANPWYWVPPDLQLPQLEIWKASKARVIPVVAGTFSFRRLLLLASADSSHQPPVYKRQTGVNNSNGSRQVTAEDSSTSGTARNASLLVVQ